LWQGSIHPSGYGYFGVSYESPRPAHRVSYELYKEALLKGLVIDHLCRNRACVNPNHLEAVSHYENLRRGETQWAKVVRTNTCIHGHEFTDNNTYINRLTGRRQCKTCNLLRTKVRRAIGTALALSRISGTGKPQTLDAILKGRTK